MNGVQLVGRLIKDVDLGYEPDELNHQNYSLLSCRNVKITFFIEYYNYWNLNSKYHDQCSYIKFYYLSYS